MRPKIIAIAAALALTIVGVGALVVGKGGIDTGKLPLSAQIGGPFELTTHEGKRLSSKELEGRPFAVFFGFTFCPDVCPTTLIELTHVIEKLGSDADRMRFFFISVDSERDTPEHLKLYLSNFDRHIEGLTGTAAEIAAVARSYRAYYEKVPTKEGFTYNHTALTYLMDAQGRLAGTIAYQENADAQLQKLRRLVGKS